MQQRSKITHQRILTAAQNEFSTHGYDATGVDEICQAAGVSKGAFYHHFPTKQAVFLELLEVWLTGLDAQLGDSRLGAGDAAQGLVKMAENAGGVFQAAYGQIPMFLEFWTQASRDPTIWQATIAPYRRYQNYFANLVREGIADGSLRPVDPDVAARVIVALAVGLLLQGLLDPQGAAYDQVTSQGVQLLMDGLSRRKA